MTSHSTTSEFVVGGKELGLRGVPGKLHHAVAVVDISTLLPADSPRLAGEDREHVRALAEAEGKLPPILVDRNTMRVVDGMHRLRASVLRGAHQIEVKFFEGTLDAAFLIAVRANTSHGLPLSREEREAAAKRIIECFPEMSDRTIALASGLSGKTVAAIRSCATVESQRLHARTGLDGRIRPLSTTEGRRLAQKIIGARPEASLREIAKEAGISPNTARDVKLRMCRGEDPVPPQQRRSREGDARLKTGGSSRRETAALRPDVDISGALRNMKGDPALRFTDAGRRLLHWLDVHAAHSGNWQDLLHTIPPYLITSVADLARECARVWQAVAEQLDRQGDEMVGPPAGAVRSGQCARSNRKNMPGDRVND